MAYKSKKARASGKCLCPFICLKSLKTPANVGSKHTWLFLQALQEKENSKRKALDLHSPFVLSQTCWWWSLTSDSALVQLQGTSPLGEGAGPSACAHWVQYGAADLPLCFLKKTAGVCQGKSPAVHVREPVSSTCCSLWDSSRAGMSDGGSGLCRFSFLKHRTMPPWFFRPRTLLLLVRSSLWLYLLCNSFSRKPLAEECSWHCQPRSPEEVRASSPVPLFSLWLPLPIFLPSPWFVTCLHLFCQPTCTQCKRGFLNR